MVSGGDKTDDAAQLFSIIRATVEHLLSQARVTDGYQCAAVRR